MIQLSDRLQCETSAIELANEKCFYLHSLTFCQCVLLRYEVSEPTESPLSPTTPTSKVMTSTVNDLAVVVYDVGMFN